MVSNTLLTAVLLGSGLALTVGGVLIYRRGLKLLGVVCGGGAGLVVASGLRVGTVPTVAAVLFGALLGLLVAKQLYVLMLLVPGGAAGFGAALLLTDTPLRLGATLTDPAILAGSVLGAILALLLQTVVVVVVSAVWGSFLTWAAVETGTVVGTLASLSVPTPPRWAVTLVGVGIVVQLLLWLGRSKRRSRGNVV